MKNLLGDLMKLVAEVFLNWESERIILSTQESSETGPLRVKVSKNLHSLGRKTFFAIDRQMFKCAPSC